jgi:hypothetical protein
MAQSMPYAHAMKTLRHALLALLVLGAARPAYGIPAFARKYGLKCSACHEAVPLLNVLGRAFRDNGYRFNNGKDDAISTDPSYWPIFAWVEENYQYNYAKSSKKTEFNDGQVGPGFAVLGAMGSLGKHISFNVRPIYAGGGGGSSIAFDVAWIRVNRLFDTDALNVRLGQIDLDMPIATASERDFTVNDFVGNLRSLDYAVPGSHGFDLLGNPLGVELSGHDPGSINRYAVTFFSNSNVGSHQLFNAPSVYGRVSHIFQLPGGFLRDFEVGAFGTYATVSFGPDSAVLKPQVRYGGSLDFWLASDALPLHVEAIGFQGRDDHNLIPGATRDALYYGGDVQVDYVPALPFELFARYNLIRNVTQAVPGRPGSFADQNVYLFGIQHLESLTSRFEWGWQLHYALQYDHLQASDGTNNLQHVVWAGLILAF